MTRPILRYFTDEFEGRWENVAIHNRKRTDQEVEALAGFYCLAGTSVLN